MPVWYSKSRSVHTDQVGKMTMHPSGSVDGSKVNSENAENYVANCATLFRSILKQPIN